MIASAVLVVVQIIMEIKNNAKLRRLKYVATGKWVELAPLVLLAYASHISSPWLLGLSASMHNIPLVIVGLGGQSKWAWYAGGTPKLPASRRALQMLAALQMTSAKNVALVDAFDTFIANPPSQSLRDSLSRLGSSEVLVGGEGAEGASEELRAGLEKVRAIGISGGRGGGEDEADAAPTSHEAAPDKAHETEAPAPEKPKKKRTPKVS